MIKKIFIFIFLFLLIVTNNLYAATINGVELENSDEILNVLKSYINVTLKYENGQYYYRQVSITNGEYEFANSGIWSAFPYDYQKFIIIKDIYDQYYGYFLEEDVEVIFKNNNFYSYVEKQTVRSEFYFASNFMSGFSNPILYNDTALFHSSLIPDGGIKNVYSSFDVYDESGNLALKGFNPFTGEGASEGASKELIVNFSYYNDYTNCYITADLKNGDYNDKIYYSDNLDNFDQFKKEYTGSGFNIDYNTVLYFKAIDVDGNIIATKSISINKLNKLSTDMFNVSVTFSKSQTSLNQTCIVIPSLNENLNDFKIFYKISNVTDDLFSSTNHLSEEFVEINNNTSMNFNTSEQTTFLITFDIRNANNVNVLYKTVQIKFKYSPGADFDISEDDYENDFSNLDENSSIMDILNVAKDTLEIFGCIFDMIPGFFWGMLSVVVFVCFLLRIMGR